MAIDGLKEVQEAVMRIEAGLVPMKRTRHYGRNYEIFASRSGIEERRTADFRVRYGSPLPIGNGSRRAVRRRRKSVQRNLPHAHQQGQPVLRCCLNPHPMRGFSLRAGQGQVTSACTFPVITKSGSVGYGTGHRRFLYGDRKAAGTFLSGSERYCGITRIGTLVHKLGGIIPFQG